MPSSSSTHASGKARRRNCVERPGEPPSPLHQFLLHTAVERGAPDRSQLPSDANLQQQRLEVLVDELRAVVSAEETRRSVNLHQRPEIQQERTGGAGDGRSGLVWPEKSPPETRVSVHTMKILDPPPDVGIGPVGSANIIFSAFDALYDEVSGPTSKHTPRSGLFGPSPLALSSLRSQVPLCRRHCRESSEDH